MSMSLTCCTVLLLTLVLCAHMWLSKADDCRSDLTNGCGSDDFNFDGPYTNSFNSACVKHDHCYNCASHDNFDFSRSKCDAWFNSNMRKICNKKKWWEIPTCYLTQATYYGLVRAIGSLHFRSNPKSYCTESWVSKCMGY